jgi:hypothetical protein
MRFIVEETWVRRTECMSRNSGIFHSFDIICNTDAQT